MNERDIGNYIGGACALDPAVITAGAGNNGVQVTGPYVDITKIATAPKLPRAVALLLAWKAVLSATYTLSLAAKFLDATDGSGTGAANYVGEANTQQVASLATTVVAIGPTGGGTVRGATKIACDLVPCRGFIAAAVTATLSNIATDTVAIAGTFIFAGFDELPPT